MKEELKRRAEEFLSVERATGNTLVRDLLDELERLWRIDMRFSEREPSALRFRLREAESRIAELEQRGVGIDVQQYTIQVEKMLCAKLGREWSPTGISVESLIDQLEQRAEQPDPYQYARRLAESMWRNHYAEDAPNWKPFDDLYGVLSQIDNMLTGLVRAEQPKFTEFANTEHLVEKFTEQSKPEPCQNCPPGVVCKTPECGRLHEPVAMTDAQIHQWIAACNHGPYSLALEAMQHPQVDPQGSRLAGMNQSLQGLPPLCPKCGNNRQVWRNQITGKLRCHRAHCDTDIPDPREPGAAPFALSESNPPTASEYTSPEWDATTDPLYDKAVQVVLETRKASVSWVQRRLGIGYNRTARIVEKMEELGIVGPSGPGGVRQLLVTRDASPAPSGARIRDRDRT